MMRLVLGMVVAALSTVHAVEQRLPQHVLGYADIRGQLYFEFELAGFGLSEDHWFRLTLIHEQEILPDGKSRSNFVVPQLRAGLKKERDGEVSLLLPGWGSYRSFSLEDGEVSEDGYVVKFLGQSDYRVSARNGWSYSFKDGALVGAEADSSLRIRCETTGERIHDLTLVAYGREKQLCHVSYDVSGLISRIVVGTRDLRFKRDAEGALLAVDDISNGEAIVSLLYENGLVTQITRKGQPTLDLKWQPSPRFRGDFLRRGRMTLLSDGIFKYRFRIEDGVAFLEGRSSEGVQQLRMNLLTKRIERK